MAEHAASYVLQPFGLIASVAGFTCVQTRPFDNGGSYVQPPASVPSRSAKALASVLFGTVTASQLIL